MLFTSLHRILGRPRGPLTDEMLDDAITAGVAESDDLDWKKSFPKEKDLANSDVPKDVAAMANIGGGLIVYGVAEKEKRAAGRVDVGEVTEQYERTFDKVAISGIHPPVFGLGYHHLGESTRALAIVVPPSIDVPHLVYRGEYFGAPIRNNADTIWMREPQLERLYRTRLDDRRNAAVRLEQDYHHEHEQHDGDLAWIIGVARPRLVRAAASPMTQDDARRIIENASALGRALAESQLSHPLATLDLNPRPGLRRWVAPPANPNKRWKEAWASVHFDGSVSLRAAIGGSQTRDGHAPPSTANSRRIEWFVADLLALVKTAADASATSEYELRIGIESNPHDGPLTFTSVDDFGFDDDGILPIRHFIPVETTVRTNVTDEAYLDQVRQIALDVVNQGGIHRVVTIAQPSV